MLIVLCLQDDMAKAEPRIDEYTAKLVSKGRWMVPGHQVREVPICVCCRWMLILMTGEMGQYFGALENCVYLVSWSSPLQFGDIVSYPTSTSDTNDDVH